MSRKGPYSSQKIRLRGLFADGGWQCDCDPRVPATKFPVSKEGPTKGKWFYTCQKSDRNDKDAGCGFFLWEEAAQAREQSAVLSNTRTEPTTPRHTSMSSTFGPPPQSMPNHSPSQKRASPSKASSPPVPRTKSPTKASTYGLPADDVQDWLDCEYDDPDLDLDTTTTESSRKSRRTDSHTSPGSRAREQRSSRHSPSQTLDRSPLSTTKKAGSVPESYYLSPFETPTTNRYRNELLQTPSKSRGGMLSRAENFPYLTPSDTALGTSPSKSLFATPATPSNADNALSDEIFKVLTDAEIVLPPAVGQKLNSICRRHALNAKALRAGRDKTRDALKNREAVIAKNNQRIYALEAETETSLRLLKRFERKQNSFGSTRYSEKTQTTTTTNEGDTTDDEE